MNNPIGNSLTTIVFVVAITLQHCTQCHEIAFGPCLLQHLEPCSGDVIKFFIFSSDHPNDTEIYLNSIDPKIPPWIDLRKTNKIIVHGYGGDLDFNATKAIRIAYLTRKNTNVIVVDWGRLANLPCYPSAAFNTKQAGECIAQFIMNVQLMNRGFNIRRLHGIGFSLGAHAISFASNTLEKLMGQKFARITGLDPALPFFSTATEQGKLDMGDADFVDVIHTNAGIFGKIESSGHVDFYVNGGKYQPGCENHRNRPLCSHMMATAYFTESIIGRKKKFIGFQCQNYFMYIFGFCTNPQELRTNKHLIAIMGEPCQKTYNGNYFVTTNKRPPYALGMDVLNKKQYTNEVKTVYNSDLM